MSKSSEKFVSLGFNTALVREAIRKGTVFTIWEDCDIGFACPLCDYGIGPWDFDWNLTGTDGGRCYGPECPKCNAQTNESLQAWKRSVGIEGKKNVTG